MAPPPPGDPDPLLHADEWATLERLGRRRTIERGRVLFREGEAPGEVVAVVGGRVKVSVLTPAGRELLLAVKGPGELLGELSAIDGRPRSATATTLDDLEVVSIPGPRFEEFLVAHPRFALRLLRALADQVREADLRAAERDSGDMVTRVARRVVTLADRYGEHRGPDVEITLALTQEDLASWVGATREATARALARLRDDGMVVTGRQRLTVIDLAALRRRADGL